MASNEPATFRLFIQSFTDFLTVAIHTILYARKVYPTTSFISAKKYNLPVRQSRHPKVCEWINDAVHSISAELHKNVVSRIVVVIYTPTNKPIERFVFDVSGFPVVPASEMDVPLERIANDGTKVNALPMVDMEEEFRATMNRLSLCSGALKEPPEACTFTVAIELKEQGMAPVSHPQPWVPAEARRKGKGKEVLGGNGHRNQTVPVRSVNAGEMVFETWIEEIRDLDENDYED